MESIGQILGLSAMVISILLYWQKRRKNVLKMKLSSDVLWSAHHLMIASYTGAATTSVAIFRELLFFNSSNKKWARSKIWYLIFTSVFFAAAIFTWKDIYSMFPAVSSCFATVAFGNKRLIMTRVFGFFASAFMLLYGVHYHSVATILNEFFTELSIILAIFRYCYVKKKG